MSLIDLFRPKSVTAALSMDGTIGIASPDAWLHNSESPLTSVVLCDLFPDLALPIDRRRAMSIASIAKSRHIITGMIARFPLTHMSGAAPAPHQNQLVKQPEIGRPLSTSLTWWTDALLFHGRCWLLIVERYAEDARARRVRWVPEHRAGVDEVGNLTRAFGEPVNPGDYIRIDGPHEGIVNFGRHLLREALDINDAAARAAANPVPSIELHQTGGTPLSDEERTKLVRDWAQARSGRGGGVAYTNQVIEARTHGQAAEQLLIAARNTVAIDMARLCGLPAWAVDAVVEGSSMTYSNAPSRARELIDFGLQPYMTAITDRLSMDDVLSAGHWARFDTTSALSPDFKTRMDGYRIAIEAGVYTPEECRQMDAGVPLEDAR